MKAYDLYSGEYVETEPEGFRLDAAPKAGAVHRMEQMDRDILRYGAEEAERRFVDRISYYGYGRVDAISLTDAIIHYVELFKPSMFLLDDSPRLPSTSPWLISFDPSPQSGQVYVPELTLRERERAHIKSLNGGDKPWKARRK